MIVFFSKQELLRLIVNGVCRGRLHGSVTVKGKEIRRNRHPQEIATAGTTLTRVGVRPESTTIQSRTPTERVRVKLTFVETSPTFSLITFDRRIFDSRVNLRMCRSTLSL